MPTDDDVAGVLAWFEQWDASAVAKDVEAMADMALFPVNAVTDGSAQSWDRARFLTDMAATLGDGEGDVRMESVRTPVFVNANLVFVITDATITAGEFSQVVRYGDLLALYEAHVAEGEAHVGLRLLGDRHLLVEDREDGAPPRSGGVDRLRDGADHHAKALGQVVGGQVAGDVFGSLGRGIEVAGALAFRLPVHLVDASRWEQLCQRFRERRRQGPCASRSWAPA